MSALTTQPAARLGADDNRLVPASSEFATLSSGDQAAVVSFKAKLSGVQLRGDYWVARCPGPDHDDQIQSLRSPSG